MELYIIWPGPTNRMISILSDIINESVPESVRISSNIDELRLYAISRNLEEYLSGLIQNNNDIINIDNTLYYTGDIKKFEVSILKSKDGQPVLGSIFLSSEGLPIDSVPQDVFEEIILSEVSHQLQIVLDKVTYNSWNEVYTKLRSVDHVKLVENLEKSQLGRFLYLLYLRDAFKSDPNVCIVISDLAPLITRVREIEMNLTKLSPEEFYKKYPSYAHDYQILKREYQRSKVYQFRLTLLLLILNISSPSLSATYDASTEKVDVTFSKSFTSLFEKCSKNTSRFIVSFIAFETSGGQWHANIIICDKVEKTVERFEPNGFSPIEQDMTFGIISEQIDIKLSEYFSQYSYTYIPPKDFCPKIGIQSLESIFYKNTGFCVSWSIIYAEERLTSKLPRSYIAQNLINDIIIKYRLSASNSQQLGINIENWMRSRIQEIFSTMERYYDELSKLLDIHVKYSQIKDSGISCLVLQ